MKRALLVCLLLGCSKPSGLVVPALSYSLAAHWQPQRTQAPLVGERVLVLNEGDDSMGAYQGGSERLRVPVGRHPLNREGPRSVIAVAGEDRYVVLLANDVSRDASGPHANRDSGAGQDGYLVEYRASDNAFLRSQRIIANGEAMRATQSLLVVTQLDLSPYFLSFANPDAVASDKYANVLIVDRESLLQRALVPACTGPRGLAISRDERTAFVACFTDEVVAISLEAPYEVRARLRVGTEVGTNFSPFYKPQNVATSPVNDDIWVSNGNSLELRVFNATSYAWDDTRTVKLDGRPDGLTFSRDGARLYAVLEDRVLVVDPIAASITQSITLPPCIAPRTLALSFDDRTGYLACDADLDKDDLLLVIDLAAGVVSDALTAGDEPTFAAVVAP